MKELVSVIIPNYNGSATIEKCLGAVFSSDYSPFEVIVVDDCSTDNSTEIIRKFPCTLVKLDERSGAAKARNLGALQSSGEILFFTDADCILQVDTLTAVANAFKQYRGNEPTSPSPTSLPTGQAGPPVKGGEFKESPLPSVASRTDWRERVRVRGGFSGENIIVGGTYTKIPYDHNNFFSAFQSIFVNYSETKNTVPDYIATHAMTITPELFRKSGGFPEDFLPILEDVEFSHRLRRSGYGLVMDPHILVRHVFNFTLMKSLRNAFRKSMFWTEYSLKNKDVFADSGTASRELKVNVASFFLSALLLLLYYFSGKELFLFLILFITALNLFSSRGLIRAFHQTKGIPFAVAATMYYSMLYPVAVGAGAIAGLLRFFCSGVGR